MTDSVIDPIELYRDVSTYNSEFNHDASDKMQFLGLGETPPPASCFICGSGNNESGYLNTGIWAEYIGNLLICTSCLIMAAEKIGCLAPSVKILFEKNIGELQDYAKNLEQELSDAEQQLSAYRTLFPGTSTIDGVGVPITPISGSTNDGELQVDGNKPKSIESTKGIKPKRVKDVAASNTATESGIQI